MSESATTNDPDLLTWRRPGPTPTQRQIDIALAFALFAGAVLSLALMRAYGFAEGEAGPGLPTSSLILAALTLPLIWRRRYPAVVAIVVSILAGFIPWVFTLPLAWRDYGLTRKIAAAWRRRP